MSLKTRLALLFTVVFLGFFLVFLINKIGKESLDRAADKEDALSDAAAHVLQARRHEKNFFMRGESYYRERVRFFHQRAKSSLNDVARIDKTPNASLDAAYRALDAYFSSFLVELERGRGPDFPGSDAEFVQKAREVETRLAELAEMTRQERKEVSARIEFFIPSLEFLLLIAVVVASLRILRSVNRSLAALNEQAALMSRGEYDPNLNKELPLEFRHIAYAMSGMVEKLQVMIETLQADVVKAQAGIAEAQNAKSRAEEEGRLKTDFLSSVSHELKTPLTSILGFSKMAARRLRAELAPVAAQANDKTRKALDLALENIDVVTKESGRLTALINQVLELTELETAGRNWDFEPVDFTRVVREALADYDAAFKAKGLALTVELEDEPLSVMGKRDRLKQIVVTLLANAVKFTEQGFVRVELETVGDDVQLSVVDSGPGVDVDHQAVIFDKYRQLGDTLTEKPQGLGLGLAAAKLIVDRHGGSLWVESQKGRGSRFGVALPKV